MGGVYEHIPLGAVGILIVIIISCFDTNKYLDEKCADDPNARDKKVPVFWLCVVAVSMLLKYFIP